MSVAVSLLKADDFLAVAITKPHCVVMEACRRDCLLYHYSSDEEGCPYFNFEPVRDTTMTSESLSAE